MINIFLLWSIPILGILLIILILKRSSLVNFFEQVSALTHHEIRMIDIYANRGIKISKIATNIEIVLFIASIFLMNISGSWGEIYKGLVWSVVLDVSVLFFELGCTYIINYYAYLVETNAAKNGITISRK